MIHNFFSYSQSSIKKVQWAGCIFEQQKQIHNYKVQYEGTPRLLLITGNLQDMTDEYLCWTVSKFLLEIKKQNGEYYPKETLYEIVTTLQIYLDLKGWSMCFLENPAFAGV